MKLALLFAGQGAQHAGMGADLYEQFPAFRQVLDECAAGVEFDLKSLCFAGPDETLNQTRYTQPCMVAFAAGVTRVLQEAGAQPAAAAGLKGAAVAAVKESLPILIKVTIPKSQETVSPKATCAASTAPSYAKLHLAAPHCAARRHIHLRPLLCHSCHTNWS